MGSAPHGFAIELLLITTAVQLEYLEYLVFMSHEEKLERCRGQRKPLYKQFTY